MVNNEETAESDRPHRFLSRTIRILRTTSAEMWVATSAVLISLSALVVSIAEVRIMRELQAGERRHQLASVWPNLTFTTSTSSSDEVSHLSLKNTGVGPAILQSVEVTVAGETVHTWPQAVAKMLGDTSSLGGHTHISAGTVMPPGSTIQLLELGDSQKRSQLKIDICYCSVFEECWRRDSILGSAAQVDSCDLAQERQFVLGE